ncbi:uncharacterized protein Dana_GF19469 [Drosophila ananassae]|uniref:Uncharacterized protein n=1 Tax=Drosophila ananassae TaxID=7217 RepID=B3MXG2_DROAN|nr:uncharacterized protein LOC6502226 [Drosophila ananassae]EDV38427.1 uncharacterized protein Dana_GF19469 [Drosophila ananassae]
MMLRTFVGIILLLSFWSQRAQGAVIASQDLRVESLSHPESLPERYQRIAQCRKLCYRESLPVITPPFLCRSRPECYMCHDYCRVLVVAQRSLATSMCADREFCTRGCRVACSYHHLWIHQHQDDNAIFKE